MVSKPVSVPDLPAPRRNRCVLSTIGIATIATFSLAWPCSSDAAAYTYFADRTSFLSSVGVTITDNYSEYGTAILTDNQMNSVLGETKYHTTYWPDQNDVGENSARDSTAYCGGCNGSFSLDFTATSIGSSQGIYGFAVDVVINDPSFPYHALLTFGNGDSQDVIVPAVGAADEFGFFGVSSYALLTSVHFGALGGLPTRSGAFIVDTLTIAAPVPEPTTFALLGFGLAGLGFLRRRQVADLL